ncbi:DUF559 domain-containing protein [Paenibacillus sp. MBLB4367]|uniref:DUF559 domain-containing protein n=1 Tax=Paenibacillus sp. MBLB4367 TaxID=3384767 RepID=UPI0039083FC2
MHPNLVRFIDQFEQEAILKGHYRAKLGKAELIFLTEVWGPAFQYNYSGLKAEYPFKDLKGGQRFADFVYVKNGLRLLIEIDGFTTHARDISPGEFDDHLQRQNDIVLSGWLVLRFSAHQVEKRTHICQRQVKQAIGHWYSIMQNGFTSEDTQIWKHRQQLVIRLAMKRDGKIKPSEAAEAFGISNKSATVWLKKFTDEGVLDVSPSDKRVRQYFLANYVSDVT